MWVDAELVNARGGEKGNERNWERERERQENDSGGARGLELALGRCGGEKGIVYFSANPSGPHPSRTGANVKRFRDVKADTRAAHFGPTTSARIVDTCVCGNIPFVDRRGSTWFTRDATRIRRVRSRTSIRRSWLSFYLPSSVACSRNSWKFSCPFVTVEFVFAIAS